MNWVSRHKRFRKKITDIDSVTKKLQSIGQRKEE